MSNHRALPVKYIKCGIGLCSLIIVLQLHDNYSLWLQVSKLITTFQLHCFIQWCCYLHHTVQMLGNRLAENTIKFHFSWSLCLGFSQHLKGEGWLRKQEWECGAPDMIHWPEQWHTELCSKYRAVVLTMALLKELGKMKKLFQNLQIFRGSCLRKSGREAGLALVSWTFVIFPSSADLLLGLQQKK